MTTDQTTDQTSNEPAVVVLDDQETTESAAAEPTRKLAANEHACIDCGVGVPDADAADLIRVDSSRPLNGAPVELKFARCVECTAISERAQELLDGHPAARQRWASAGLHRIASALLALDLIGQPLPDGPMEQPALARLVRHLFEPGASARWVTDYAPTVARPTGRCAVTRWSHVDERQALQVRAGYARALAERRAAESGPVRVPCPEAPDPDLAACLLCGVGAVEVSAVDALKHGGLKAAEDLCWSALVVATPGVIGAPPSPEAVRGWTCPACTQAIRDVGSVGHRACMQSLRTAAKEQGNAALDARLATVTDDGLDTIVSWAGVVLRRRGKGYAAPRPNRVAWAHVAQIKDPPVVDRGDE